MAKGKEPTKPQSVRPPRTTDPNTTGETRGSTTDAPKKESNDIKKQR